MKICILKSFCLWWRPLRSTPLPCCYSETPQQPQLLDQRPSSSAANSAALQHLSSVLLDAKLVLLFYMISLSSHSAEPLWLPSEGTGGGHKTVQCVFLSFPCLLSAHAVCLALLICLCSVCFAKCVPFLLDNWVDCQGHIVFTCCRLVASLDPVARLCVLIRLLSSLITLLLFTTCLVLDPPPPPPSPLDSHDWASTHTAIASKCCLSETFFLEVVVTNTFSLWKIISSMFACLLTNRPIFV